MSDSGYGKPEDEPGTGRDRERLSKSSTHLDRRTDELVLRAAALDAGEREALLRRTERDEPRLAAEVRRRLDAASDMPESFLGTMSDSEQPDSDDPTEDPADGEDLPERIGVYRLEGQIGEGGMGEVYRGWDERLERPVALKRLLAAAAGSSAKSRDRFRREARSVARVSHSAIVQIYDWIEGEAMDWIVMELVDGSSLHDLTAEGPVPPKHVARIGRQIAAGLAAAHKVGLVHRDLKVENVMLTSDGEVRILDFGLAKRISAEDGIPLSTRISQTGEVVGTVTAMSPEQALGQPVDHRSDLFSLGSLLYHLATGVLPFTGDNQIEVLTRICTVQAVPIRHHDETIPEELARVIERCLEKDPAHRPPSAEVVAEALDAAMMGLVTDTWEAFNPEAAASRAAASRAETRIGDDSIVVSGLLDPAAPSLPSQGETGTRVRTLLLNDLVDSTSLVDKLGDEHAARIFEQHDRMARDLLKRHEGREIDKSDGFLMLFERPIDAVRFALGYHAALAEISDKEGVEVASRVGIHVGEVVLRTNTRLDVARGAKPLEVEGLAKAMAARFMSLAGARQTLISRGVYDLARRSAVGAKDLPEGLQWPEHGRYSMQGVEDPVEVFEVGVEGAAPLAAPTDSKKVTKVEEEKGVFLTHRRLMAMVAAVLLLVGGFALWQWWRKPQHLEVAVMLPNVTITDSSVEAALVSGAVRGALIRSLTSLEAVSVPSGDQMAGIQGTSVEIARALATDEVVSAELECALRICQVTLSRILAESGDATWAATFSSRADDLLVLHNAVLQNLRRGYTERPAKGGMADLEVRSQDYAAYLRLVNARNEKDSKLSEEEILRQAQELQSTSPRFLEAYLLEAVTASALHYHTREKNYLETSLEASHAANALAPENPLPLLQLELTARNADLLEVWEEALEELERISPGSPRVLSSRALLLEKRGQGEEGLARMREAAELHPSWEILRRLAMMEYRHSHIAAARQHLQHALELSPGHFTMRVELAQIELLNGDPARAVELYEALVEQSPEVNSLVNLGVGYLLVERYSAAVDAFRRATDIAPGQPFLLLNLADAELLLNRPDEAAIHYRQVLGILEQDALGETWQGKSVRAQALAHLGEFEAAVAMAQEAALSAPDNPQVALEVAMVYALAGERTSAIVNVERAITGGVEPRWFRFPWFESLRDDPRFQALVVPRLDS